MYECLIVFSAEGCEISAMHSPHPSQKEIVTIFHSALHEIGTPVNGIVTAASLLKDEIAKGNTETVNELLQMISSASDNLTEIFQRIRQTVRYEEIRRFELFQDVFDFRKWLDNLVLSMLPLFLDKQISIVKHIPDNFPAAIFTDRIYLSQVVNNILMNALKYSEPSTVVTLNCFMKDEFCCIEIEDQGKGISPEELPYIFREYYTLSEDVQSRFGGIGMGLSISKELVDLMGGRIEVNSKQGEGSTFTIMVPVNGTHLHNN